VRFNVDIARQSLAVIGKIFTREVAAKNALAGPIEIAAQSGAAARTGWKNLFYLMGVLSLSIGLLNLFPIPILDGGQIAILLFESIVRRDLSLAVKERIAQVGFALVVLLMVTVLWFDLSKNLF
jgi:regulator of sigma E protease